MTVLEQLCSLSAAEEFFQVLEVPYDAAVLNVARLHILKRMGEYLRRDAVADADDDTARRLCKEHLERAYFDFVRSSPLAERVFKGLKEAVNPPSAPLVPLSMLTGADSES